MAVRLLAGHKQKRESQRAIRACNEYLRMGPARSYSKVLARFEELGPEIAPTLSSATINDWGTKYGWASRADLYDERIEAERQARYEALLNEGLALMPERLAKLNKLFELLEGELFEEGAEGQLHNLWLPDVKAVGAGESMEVIDIERYNSPLIGDIRGLLDDIAKEVGGRKQRADITSGDKPLDIVGIEVVRPEAQDEPE